MMENKGEANAAADWLLRLNLSIRTSFLFMHTPFLSIYTS